MIRGKCNSRNQRRNIVPSIAAAQLLIQLVAMLIPAATKAIPVKYAQNNPGPGIHGGIRVAIKLGIRKWLMPKTTEDTARKARPDRIKPLRAPCQRSTN